MQNGRIFVHGVEGLNRSAAVIIAYLMRATPCLLDEAYFYLQVLRPFIRVTHTGWPICSRTRLSWLGSVQL